MFLFLVLILFFLYHLLYRVLVFFFLFSFMFFVIFHVFSLFLLAQVMFRAGKLAELEEIREAALTTIITKMQCHARIAIVKLDLYNGKKAEKQAFACLQRNIR